MVNCVIVPVFMINVRGIFEMDRVQSPPLWIGKGYLDVEVDSFTGKCICICLMHDCIDGNYSYGGFCTRVDLSGILAPYSL